MSHKLITQLYNLGLIEAKIYVESCLLFSIEHLASDIIHNSPRECKVDNLERKSSEGSSDKVPKNEAYVSEHTPCLLCVYKQRDCGPLFETWGAYHIGITFDTYFSKKILCYLE